MTPSLRLLALLTLSTLTSFAAGEKIAVIPKGTTHSFWKTVEAGAREAAKELGAEVVWKGPIKEDDRAQQIAVVQQFIGGGIDAIAVAPLDDVALRPPVRSAMERKMPVVIFDSALKGEAGKDFVSFVATNNRRGGEMAGEALVAALKGKGKVALLRYSEGSASTAEREAGFLDVMKKHPGIEIILENRYAGVTSSSAQDAAMNLIDKLREADGIYTPNESSTLGMLLALRQTGLAGKKVFVGFDTSTPLLAGLQKGEIHSLVTQNPHRMGYLAVKTAVAALRKEPFEANIDTGCALVTKENRHTPEIEAILGK